MGEAFRSIRSTPLETPKILGGHTHDDGLYSQGRGAELQARTYDAPPLRTGENEVIAAGAASQFVFPVSISRQAMLASFDVAGVSEEAG